jgi:3-oxoacyl-(acyl-carrier-protein) synthase
MAIYINTIKQISAQMPLLDDWFGAPIAYSEAHIRSIEPDYKPFFAPNVSRRLGKILKRALLVSKEAMKASDVSAPDAIITGTGLGCIENSEIFLDKLVREGESLLTPTHFTQSTHNTISSLVAIDAKCHSYNTTYAHKGISFESALMDAFLQMTSGKIKTALVGAHDEMTPLWFSFLQKSGYLGNENQTFAGETAVAMMLDTIKSENSLCSIEAVEKIYTQNLSSDDVAPFQNGEIDYILVGTNGVEANDRIYLENCAKLFPNIPLLQYKNVFGESYTAPALGVYAAALCLQKNSIPDFLLLDKNNKTLSPAVPSKILCYNHFENKNHTFILLSNV